MEDLFNHNLWESQRVKFYEFGHKYLLDGKRELIGVTSLMKKHGLSPDYSGIDAATLSHAAALGTAAHKRIEDYCEGRPVPDCKLIKSFKKLGLNIERCEYLVTDEETVASSIDLLAKVEEGVYDIIDMKRTSSVHRDALAYQLGFYKTLFLKNNPWAEVRKCFCLPIKKGNKDDIEADSCGALVEITPVPEEKVLALIKAETEGREYKEESENTNILPYSDIMIAINCTRKINELMKSLDLLEQAYDEARGRIYDKMMEHNVDKLEVGGLSITLKRPYTKTSIDSARLKEEKPEVYDKYTKTCTVKGNVTIKLK